ncbi:MAG: TIGR03936 family radical SAM-associated protein [Fusobacteriaceae bacterium]
MKKRIYFNKCEEMRFISHLDLLRFFERIMIKAEIPVKYSQGFHPRPKFSFGNPISLGTAAYNEVMDIELEEFLENEFLLEKFNCLDIKGFQVLKVEDITDKISIVDKFKVAIYEIASQKEKIDLLFNLLSQEEIVETKEKKGKIVERNLKEKVKGFSRESEEKLLVYLSNGSPNAYLDMSKIQDSEVVIKKLGYKL